MRATFEQQPGDDRRQNVRDWFGENSKGVATLGQVRYAGCTDGLWYAAPPQRQGMWYWTQMPVEDGFAQMRRDALAAADADVDFHTFDTDHDNTLSVDELIVIVVLPQGSPYGAARWASMPVDGDPQPMNFSMIDLYLSSEPRLFRDGVGIAVHEISHHYLGALDLYGVCAQVDPGFYSIMDVPDFATHLDPFEKMKNGFLQPLAIDLSVQESATFALPAVESRHQVLLLHHPDRVAREYYLIENRYPGNAGTPNYDGPLNQGAVVVWQIFEQASLSATSAVCPGDVRFIRKRAVLMVPGDTFALTWSDGASAGFTISAPIPNAELAKVFLQKL